MKLVTTILVSIGLVFAIGCGKKDEKKEGADKGASNASNSAKTAAAGDMKKAAPAPKAAAASPAMMAFMTDLKGKSDDVTAALKTHGVEGLDSKDMDLYNLASPKVVKVAGDCETMEAKSGMTTRTYVVCWKDGKIATIEDKGMR